MLPGAFHTTRLLLRPIAPEDAGPIFDSYAQDLEATRFLTWRPHRNVGDTAAYIARCIAMSPRIARTYVVCEAGAIRGALGLRLDDPYRLEVGYVLARSCWGAGLITEALREVAHWALAQPRILPHRRGLRRRECRRRASRGTSRLCPRGAVASVGGPSEYQRRAPRLLQLRPGALTLANISDGTRSRWSGTEADGHAGAAPTSAESDQPCCRSACPPCRVRMRFGNTA